MADKDPLLELDGAIIRFLAANHASLCETYADEHETATADMVIRCIVDLRDACNDVLRGES